jgi:hypothetical protein
MVKAVLDNIPLEAVGKQLRNKLFYTVPAAGKKIGLGRVQSYTAASRGHIPAQRHGKYLLVARAEWDAKVELLLRTLKTKD